MKAELTQMRLMEVLHYDKDTGLFTWLVGKNVGAIAGTRIDGVQVEIKIDGKRHFARRLAFLYVNGEWPIGKIYHHNKIGDDNTWSNLFEMQPLHSPGITKCKMTGLYRDDNGNYWSTLKDANKYAKTMYNCTDCFDCHHCTDCHHCNDIDHCTGCTGCSWCTGCVNCTGCHHCYECLDCHKCENMVMCHHCTGCVGCHYCHYITDSNDLIAKSNKQ